MTEGKRRRRAGICIHVSDGFRPWETGAGASYLLPAFLSGWHLVNPMEAVYNERERNGR